MVNILTYILSILYFCLPIYMLNMTPPVAAKLKIFDFLGIPVDFNKKFLNKPIFGNHKTLRGIVSSYIVGVFYIFLQKQLYNISFFYKLSLIDYQAINLLCFSILFSSGAILGDLFFAFIKRRLNLEPGAPFMPFDQINYILGSMIFIEPFFKIGI